MSNTQLNQPTLTAGSAPKKTGRQLLSQYSTLVALALLFIIANFISPVFAQADNLTNITMQIAVNGILAVGMTMVVLTGGIDLGVGAVAGLCGVVLAMTADKYGIVPAILATLLTGLLIGLWNALFITRFNIPPFIVTLGMMTIARGLALYISEGSAIALPVNDFLTALGSGYLSVTLSTVLIVLALLGVLWTGILRVRRDGVQLSTVLSLVVSLIVIGLVAWVYLSYQGIPYLVLVFALIVLWGVFILNKTTFGRYLYAIGGNAKAALLSGVPVKMNLVKVYVTSALLASVAGIVMTTRVGSGDPTGGNMFELDAVAAAVIGGTSLSGGYGTVVGSLIGAFI
ncbi:MAG: hypothetical protein WCC10_00025, partial [Tumebacillaceae bacterium]